jgi:branched-chain amino acid transport system ATP-binding protein
MAVDKGEVVSLLGRNGAGKTTTVLTIMGYLAPDPGTIVYAGANLKGLPPFALARRGFGFVPQERGIFPSLTVEENLTVAARTRAGHWTLGRAYACFRGWKSDAAISASSCRAASSRCSRSPAR